MRFATRRLIGLSFGVIFVFGACGGGGGSSPSAVAPCDANTKTCYVQTNGSNQNIGDQANPLQTISKAAAIATTGYHIIVGSGIYHETVTTATTGAAPDSLTFSAVGKVVIDATTPANAANRAGFKLTNSPGTVIDGFEIINAADAGIVIKSNSHDFTVRNCSVHDNPGDGIRIQDSANVTVFNNLIYNNGTAAQPGGGIIIAGVSAGSPDATIVNNTVYGHFDRGLTIGTTSVASPGAFVHDNILQNNSNAPGIDGNIKVYTSPRSDLNYDGNFNLVASPATYRGVNKGANDVSSLALFVDVASGNFHLQTTSPAIDAGDPGLDPNFANPLHQRTTTGTVLDTGTIDIGFHYPQ